MKNLLIFLLANLFMVSVFGFDTKKENIPTSTLSKGKKNLVNQKIGFEENKGQVTGEDGAKVKYSYQAGGLSIFLMPTGIAYQFNKIHYPEGYENFDNLTSSEKIEKRDKLANKIRIETYRMNVDLVGANPKAKITTQGKSKDYVQYYNHNALDVHHFNEITYQDIYPNIDWVIYKNGETIKYDFIVHPGGNPDLIKLKTTHAEDIEIDQDGNLVLSTIMGAITEKKPVSFQNNNEISTEFVLNENVLTFEIEEFNTGVDLVIDPVLDWATYYGGNAYDQSYSCVVDDSNNVYISGVTGSNSGISGNGHQITFGGLFDSFIAKFNSSGGRIWATYYGGSGTDDSFSCAVDDSSNVYFCGRTLSSSGIAFNGFQNTKMGHQDAFLVKLSSSGTRLWATYFGGTGNDFGRACFTDSLGNVYLSGNTNSTGLGINGYQNTYGGGFSDAFLVKFGSSGTRLWATYYGGTSEDYGSNGAVDNLGNVYLTGNTHSSSGISLNGHQNTFGGLGDTYLVKFNASGTRLWATYYGGAQSEGGEPSCAIDDSGNVFLTGGTSSITGIALNGHQNTYMGGIMGGDAFIVKFSSSGIREWGTYYGGVADDIGVSCDVDDLGNVYVVGWTESTSNIAFGTGIQSSNNGAEDAFIVKLSSSGLRLWGSYYGGSSYDHATSCALDNNGNIYFSGGTSSTNNIAFNGFKNAHGPSPGSDAYLTKILCADSVIDMQIACISYTWINGVNYTSSNSSATHILTNSSGCDSIVTLNLVINNPSYSTDVHSACSSFTWIDGITYTSNNDTSTYVLTNVHGCDSIVTLDLEVFYPNTGYDIQIGCDSYTSVSGKTWTTSGTYLDTLTNSAGCDSIVTLDLTINQSSSFVDVHSACNSYVWIDGVTYTTSNYTATHTLVNSMGCDSLVTLNLSINSNSSDDVIFACNSYKWTNGVIYTSSNNSDTVVYMNAAGCDSVVTLNLTIGNGNTGIDVLFACDSLTWIDGITYTANNNQATYTVTNASGCDSIVTLNLTIGNVNTGIDVQMACDSYTSISGKTWTTSGIYLDTLTNLSGCDSVVTLNLTINHSNPYTEVLTVCDSLTWIDGVTYTNSNYTATHLLSTVNGCDSLVTLNLTINSNKGIDTRTACDSFTWIDGITYYTSNYTAKDTLINAWGCDSIVTLNLTLYPIEYSIDTRTVCDSLTWINGITYYSSINTVSDTLANRYGCDSIVSLDLTVYNSSTEVDSVSACLFYQWSNGQIFVMDNNTATQNFIGVNGCDSIIALNLEIHSGTFATDTHVVCDSLVWIDGNTYFSNNSTAMYTLVGGNSNGCDSIVTLNLTVNGTSELNVITACESYTWIDGITYTLSNNTATYTLTNSAGCDSVISLNLTIHNSTIFTDVISSCVPVTWIDGNTYSTSNNTATHILTNAAGCDSIVTLDLTMLNSTTYTDMISSCIPITWIDGNVYSQSINGPTYTLINHQGCDSVVTLDFTLLEVDTSVTRNHLTFTAQATNATYQWIDCQTGIISGATNADFTARVNGSYQVEVTQNGCVDTSACFAITNVGVQEAELIDVLLYPNPTSDVLYIDKGSNIKLEITITNSVGATVYYRSTESQITTVEMKKMATGMYVVTMQNELGIKMEKVIKR